VRRRKKKYLKHLQFLLIVDWLINNN
jgi:hypothetical protein